MTFKPLNQVADLISEKVSPAPLTKSSYISTENMLPDKRGVIEASSIPSGKVNAFEKGDTLFSNIRTYFKKIWQAEFSGGASADVLIFRSKDTSTLLPDYLYYLLCDEKFVAYTVATAKGAKMPRGDKSAIMKYVVNVPSISYQKAAVNTLKALDNKIALNQQINQTLEQVCRTIYKSWFVDFEPVKAKIFALEKGLGEEGSLIAAMQSISGKNKAELTDIKKQKPEQYAQTLELAKLFPSRMKKSSFGPIPEGWSISPFSKVARLDTTSVKPNKTPSKIWEHYSIPAFDECISPAYEIGQNIKSNKYQVHRDAVLSSKLNPHFPRTWVPDLQDEKGAICSTEFMQFVPLKSEQRAYIAGIIDSEPFQDGIKMRATGSTGSRQRSQPKQVAVMDIVLPNSQIINAYSQYTSPLYSIKGKNIWQSRNLENIRDTLLPEFLSGALPLTHFKSTDHKTEMSLNKV